MLGILQIDKPQGITSHDVVSRMRKRFNTRRIGHAGTLDPLATGLLVIAVGPATRFLQYLQLEPKEYVCTFRFGAETNTFDAEGEVTNEKPVPENLEERINEELEHFRGDIKQLPPMFSAVKKDGRPLYVYARKGEEVERQKREVFIKDYELLERSDSEATFRIVCSGGTYVRTLAHDLGQAVGCGAYVSELRRTQVGRFHIDQATTIEEVGPDDLTPLAEALEPMPIIRLNDGQFKLVQNGNFIKVDEAPAEPFAALADENGNVLSIARVSNNELHPECVIPMEALYGQV